MNRKGTREQNDISIIRNLPKRLQRRIVEDIGDDSLVTVGDGEDDICAFMDDAGRASTSTGGNMTVLATAKKDDYEFLPGPKAHKQQPSSKIMPEGNRGSEVTRINFFLQKSKTPSVKTVSSNLSKSNYKGKAEPVLETSGKAAVSSRNSVTMKNDVRGINQGDGHASIPGILRLNDAKQVQLIKAEKNKIMGGKLSSRENSKKTTDMRFQQFHDHSPQTSDDLLTKSPVRQLQQQAKPPPWFEMLADAQFTERLNKSYEKINMMMIQQYTVNEKWSEFNEARYELQQIFAKLLLQQLKLCCEQKIDTFFWKLLYYNVREYFKTNKKSTPDYPHNRLLVLFDEGIDFYARLHMQLNAKYIDIDQKTHTNNSPHEKTEIPTQRPTHKFQFIAKVAAQKLLICLGDLCRYKAKELQSNDYNDAAKYYQQAQALIPTNGIPYNQLAIVAINARKKFDAVYFHMRSLMSSNAIYSARESLLVLFDEIRKKYEETELKTSSPAHHNSPRHNNARTSISMRKEVWIHVDGVRRLHRSSECDDNSKCKNILLNEEKRFNGLESEELLRRFTSLYLYVIGKLYTGIGMETIIEHQRKLLVQLSVLLKRSTFPIKRSRLLRIVALNIFVLEHNMHKESRREIRYYAFNFCNQIFGLLLSKCNTLFTTFEEDVMEDQVNHVDLNTFLQYIKIYSEWLARYVDFWESLRSEEHAIVDTWAEWECFHTWIKHLLQKSTAGTTQTQHIILEEDLYLLGFTPLMSKTNQINNSMLEHNGAGSDSMSTFIARIHKISIFNESYEKHKTTLIMHDDSFTLEELNGPIQKVLCDIQNDADDNTENIVVNGTSSENAIRGVNVAKAAGIEDAQISQLSLRRKELEARTNVKKQYNAKLDEILNFVDTKLYIEVRPRYLMPDTNCFIDCLDDFQKLIQDYKRYILVIPLTVVKELDGLSKGVKVESYQNSLQMHRIHHYDDVSTCAKRSLDFIRSAKYNVKCATTKGSFINSSLFALAEEEHVSNDDKILATALALSKTMSTETYKDGKCLIQTELVLITTDRNLRVKALARNLTVSEMSEFLQWVKDGNT